MSDTIDFNKKKEELKNKVKDGEVDKVMEQIREILECLVSAQAGDGQAMIIYNDFKTSTFWKFNMMDEEVNMEIDKLKMYLIQKNINTYEE